MNQRGINNNSSKHPWQYTQAQAHKINRSKKLEEAAREAEDQERNRRQQGFGK